MSNRESISGNSSCWFRNHQISSFQLDVLATPKTTQTAVGTWSYCRYKLNWILHFWWNFNKSQTGTKDSQLTIDGFEWKWLEHACIMRAGEVAEKSLMLRANWDDLKLSRFFIKISSQNLFMLEMNNYSK